MSNGTESKSQTQRKRIDTGGAAFPRPAFTAPGAYEDGYVNQPEDGMTLRDYFAAYAMQSVFAATYDTGGAMQEEIASEAYEIADAMLVARKAGAK